MDRMAVGPGGMVKEGIPKLVLHPADWERTPPSIETVVFALRSLGFIGEPLADSGAYAAGNEYLSLITFLGCSPAVATDAQAGCMIRLRAFDDAPQFLGGGVTPRCPACRTPVEDWRAQVAEWYRDPTGKRPCSGCSRLFHPAELDWRHCAGFGRLFIEMAGVYPSEAVPGERLLGTLAALSGGAWGFFYTAVETSAR